MITQSNINKSKQLDENISTATAKLKKNILWNLIQQTNQTKCFVCGKEMSKDTFTIEHKISWLNKENAKELFYDLNNISFSHSKCNTRKPPKLKHGTIYTYKHHHCRCELCIKAMQNINKKYYDSEKRRKRYLKYGT